MLAWTTFAEHAARLYGVGAAGMRGGAGWFLVVSGGSHPDLNPAALFPGSPPGAAGELMASVAEDGVPALISVSPSADAGAAGVLAGAGYVPAPVPEALMCCTARPGRQTGGFRVARVADRAELDLAIGIAADTHAVDAESARTLVREVRSGESVGTWIAWDGEEPVSVVWMTLGDDLGVWSMMTPERHRRRGAGRAVLTAALDDAWSGSTRAALLWATPLGRPLYESVGFSALAEAVSWVPAGFGDELAALGHSA